MRTNSCTRTYFRFPIPSVVVEFNGTLNAHAVVRQDFRYFLLRPVFSFYNTDRWTGRPVTIRSAQKAYIRLYMLTCIVDLRRMRSFFFSIPFDSRFLFDYTVCRQRNCGANRSVVLLDVFRVIISRFRFSHSRVLSKTGSRIIKLSFLFTRLFVFFCDYVFGCVLSLSLPLPPHNRR